MWNIHNMAYYLATRSNELLIHATTWMNLKNSISVKEASHKTPHTVWFCLYEIARKDKSIEKESRLMVA